LGEAADEIFKKFLLKFFWEVIEKMLKTP